jgi:hypothetical protein
MRWKDEHSEINSSNRFPIFNLLVTSSRMWFLFRSVGLVLINQNFAVSEWFNSYISVVVLPCFVHSTLHMTSLPLLWSGSEQLSIFGVPDEQSVFLENILITKIYLSAHSLIELRKQTKLVITEGHSDSHKPCLHISDDKSTLPAFIVVQWSWFNLLLCSLFSSLFLLGKFRMECLNISDDGI